MPAAVAVTGPEDSFRGRSTHCARRLDAAREAAVADGRGCVLDTAADTSILSELRHRLTCSSPQCAR